VRKITPERSTSSAEQDWDVVGKVQLTAAIRNGKLADVMAGNLNGTNDWTELALPFEIADRCTPKYFAADLIGTGTVWVGNLRLVAKEKSAGDPGVVKDGEGATIVDFGEHQGEAPEEFLRKRGVQVGGTVNFWLGVFLPLSLMVQPMDSLARFPHTIFYDKSFKYYTAKWSNYYAPLEGGKICGLRFRWAGYGNRPLPGKTGYIFSAKGGTLDTNHPSYILVNGVKIWEHGQTPMLKVGVYRFATGFFYLEEDGYPVVDIVMDRAMHPDVDKMDIRYCHLNSLGNCRVKEKHTSYGKLPSPGDTCEKWESGLVRIKGDVKFVGYTPKESGPATSLRELRSAWKPYRKPAYPVDGSFIAASAVNVYNFTRFNEDYEAFLMEYCGTNSAITGAYGDKERAFMEKYRDRIEYILETNAAPAERLNDIFTRFPDKKVVLGLEVWDGYAPAAFKKTADASRTIRMVEVFPAGLNNKHLLSWHKGGVEIAIQKNQEGPQNNILVSNVRGAAKATGGRYGHHWEGTQVPPLTPDFKEQALLLWFLSGADFVAPQEEATSDRLGSDMLATIRANRLMMLHPRRGRQVVKIGVLRGLEEIVGPYNRFACHDIPQRDISYDHSLKKLEVLMDIPPEAWDYDLLDVFFPKYGNMKIAKRARMLTGTPYGPVDLLHTDLAEAGMNDYRLLVFLGNGRMTAEVERKLRAYVEGGGHHRSQCRAPRRTEDQRLRHGPHRTEGGFRTSGGLGVPFRKGLGYGSRCDHGKDRGMHGCPGKADLFYSGRPCSRDRGEEAGEGAPVSGACRTTWRSGRCIAEASDSPRRGG
jgi:hypothetical protein